MSFIRNLISFQLCLITSASLAVSPSTNKTTNFPSLIGGADAGGANAVGGQLFDFYENQGSEDIEPITEMFWKLSLRLFYVMYSFHWKISESRHEISWILEPKKLSEEKCINYSVFLVNKEIVACQNINEVRISKAWWDQADEKNQSGLILHEALVHEMLKKLYNLTPEERMNPKNTKEYMEPIIRDIVRRFFSLDEKNLKYDDNLRRLQKVINSLGIGIFPLNVSEFYIEWLRKSLMKSCQKNKSSVKNGRDFWDIAMNPDSELHLPYFSDDYDDNNPIILSNIFHPVKQSHLRIKDLKEMYENIVDQIPLDSKMSCNQGAKIVFQKLGSQLKLPSCNHIKCVK